MRNFKRSLQVLAASVVFGGLMPAAVQAQTKTIWVNETRTVQPVYSNPKDRFAATWNPYLRPRQVTVRRHVTASWDARRQAWSYVDSHNRNQWVADPRPADRWENGWFHHFDDKGVEWITRGGAWQFYKVPGAANWTKCP